MRRRTYCRYSKRAVYSGKPCTGEPKEYMASRWGEQFAWRIACRIGGVGIDPDELAPEPPNLERALIAENFLMIQLRNSSEFSAVCFLVAAKEYDGEVLFPSVEARRKMIKQGATPKKSRILPELPLAGDEDLADFVAPVKHYPTISMGYQNELRNCRLKLRQLIQRKNCAPVMLLLGWNSAATYDRFTKTGGPFGTIGNLEELADEANRGVDLAIRLLNPIKKKHSVVSLADLYQLAGVVAIQAIGGPEIPFHAGRVDKSESPPDGRLPDATEGLDHMRKFFGRMGFGDKEGRYYGDESTFAGPMASSSSPVFDNSYYKNLLSADTLPSADKALVDDPKFRRYIEKYASDGDTFAADYVETHVKFSEFGFADGQ